ncbi:hypothetical protein [Sphingomonas phage Carli]|nr:hypothetical protein [Sphingomonas phage Carli]
METTTILLWSESNRAVVDAIEALTERLETIANSINYGTEASRALSKDVAELRHQIERVRDRMT